MTSTTEPSPLTPYRKITPIPDSTLVWSKCPLSTSTISELKIYSSDWERGIHYFQQHILCIGDQKVRGELLMRDEGNYDGPLGTGRHFFQRSRFFKEPGSYFDGDEEDEAEGEEETEEDERVMGLERNNLIGFQMGGRIFRKSRL